MYIVASFYDRNLIIININIVDFPYPCHYKQAKVTIKKINLNFLILEMLIDPLHSDRKLFVFSGLNSLLALLFLSFV